LYSLAQRCASQGINPVDHASRTGLTNLWHACPKWHVERFPCQAAFAAVPIFVFLLPDQRLHVVNNMCIHTHVCVGIVCELPLLPNASETFLQKSGVLRSADWVFIIGAPAWR
jgi:hypothetical protein